MFLTNLVVNSFRNPHCEDVHQAMCLVALNDFGCMDHSSVISALYIADLHQMLLRHLKVYSVDWLHPVGYHRDPSSQQMSQDERLPSMSPTK